MVLKTILVENSESGQKFYESVHLSPKNLGALGNELSLKILGELSKEPLCAMDVAKKMNIHEQKIYYHLRKLERSGLIKIARTERRFGLIANMYDVVSPVVHTKISDSTTAASFPSKNPSKAKLLIPFIENGKLTSKIIIGSPLPHGRFEKGAYDGSYVNDLALFMGNFLSELHFPCYKLDTLIREKDLKDNLIIIGSPTVNTVTDMLNSGSWKCFDEKKDWSIVSKNTGKTYNEDYAGIVLKCANPFDPHKKILLIAGRRSYGTIAAIIAFTQHTEKLFEKGGEDFARIVVGTDRDSDGFIDSVHFLE